MLKHLPRTKRIEELVEQAYQSAAKFRQTPGWWKEEDEYEQDVEERVALDNIWKELQG